MTKLKTSFVVKKYNGTHKSVMLYLSFGYKEYNSLTNKETYKPLRYYTGVTVKNTEWDSIKKLPTNSKQLKELQTIEQTAIDIFSYLERGNGSITPDSLRIELDEKLKGKEIVVHVIGLVDFIEKVTLESMGNRSLSTKRGYEDLAKRLKEFQERKGIILTVKNFDEAQYMDFMDDMRNRFNRLNSVTSTYRKLVYVLNDITRKYKIEVFNPSAEIATIDQPSLVKEEKVYLSFSQIQKILDYNPIDTKTKNVKLIFITLLFTGCRYSDVFKIHPEYKHSKEGVNFNYARYIDQKTKTDIIAPILHPLEQAYKIHGGLPKKITGSQFNLTVKELAQQAGLTDLVKMSYTDAKGNKKFEEKSLYKFVSSHTGRRSFITNLINFVPVTVLSKITGHSLTNQNVIFGYNKISLIDNAVLFVKELKRVAESNPKEFPIRLV
ncbi:MAG: integrase [Crocinitomicaceae bacterium]|jgi:integrase